MNKKRWIIVLMLLAIILFLRFISIGDYINLQQLKEHRDYLQKFAENNYAYAALLFILTYASSVALSLPVAAILTIAGGLLFGTFWGAVYANIGATLGASIAFLLVRYVIGAYVQKNYKQQLEKFNQEMRIYGTNYLLSIHLIAIVPFFLINLLAGLTQISLWTFMWTTSVGIFPGALVYAFAGQQLTTIEKISDIFSLNIILAFVGLAILALMPVLIKRFKKRK